MVERTTTRSAPRRQRPTRRRRSDGKHANNAILDEAARLATVEGITELSISRLADAVAMSKSGPFAHSDSKEELQLATIEATSSLFATEVLEPASSTSSGLDRLRRPVDAYLRDVEAETFPGASASAV